MISPSQYGSPARSISFVVAAKDEDKTIRMLFDEILEVMRELDAPWEFVIVDDGSRDGTWGAIVELADDFPDHIRGFRLDESVGKSMAQAFGLREARGDFLLTMDADMQDDPAMTGRFIDRMRGDFDIVTGWRKKRQDRGLDRLSSNLFNKLANFLTMTPLQDRNCGMHCFKNVSFERREELYRMHRILPSLGRSLGLRVSEVEVEHRARKFGHNHHRPSVFWQRLRELIAIYFQRGATKQPGPFFLGVTIFGFVAAGLLGAGAFFVPVNPATQELLFALAATFGGAAVITGAIALFGYSSVKRIQRGGRQVSVASTLGIGLTVNEDAIVLPPEFEAPSVQLPDLRRALVADDDPSVLRLMEQILTREGWDVTTALTLREAVEALDSSMHVAFLDVHMPEANSMEVIELMQQRSPGTRYVSFTGDRDPALGAEAFRRGASDFLRKPIQFEEVITAANAAFGDGDRARETGAPVFFGSSLSGGGSQ